MLAGYAVWGLTWIAIRARTTEIGVSRAIGATRVDVLWLYLTEALAGSVLGCLAGGLAGYALTRWLDIRLQ